MRNRTQRKFDWNQRVAIEVMKSKPLNLQIEKNETIKKTFGWREY
jgi:hypothetical protein